MVAIVLISLVGTKISDSGFNLSLQAMIRKTNLSDTNNEVLEICPEPQYFKEKSSEDVIQPTNNNSSRLRDKSYDWDQTTQSLLYGFFFVSSVVFKPIFGILVQKFGGKWFLTGCLFVSCFLSIIFPFTTDYIYLLVVVRLLMGTNAALVFPSVYSIIVNWVPLKRRSLCFSLFGASISFSTIAGLLTTGVILKKYGWPGLFFMPATVSGIIGIITLIFLRDEPKELDKKLVTSQKMRNNDSQEKIMNEGNDEKKTRSLSTPFRSILRNKAVLSYLFFQFSQGFTTSVMGSKLPVYFTKVLHEDLGGLATWMAITVGIAGLSSMLSGFIADKLINKKFLNPTNTRKLSAIISGIGTSVCVVCIPAAGCSTKAVYAILCFSSFSEGFSSSLISLPSDMTKNFSSFTFSIGAMMQAVAGFVAPLFAGLILDHVKNQWTAWCILYWTTGPMMILTTVVFVICGSAERQDFDFVDNSCTRNKDGSLSSKC